MLLRFFSFCFSVFLLCSCMSNTVLSPKNVKELAVKHFHEKEVFSVRDTGDVGVLLINTGLEGSWYVAFNKVMTTPTLFLYQIDKPFDPPHYIPLQNKSASIIESVFFRNVTNDEEHELVIELYADYGLAYQSREIVVLRHPFRNPTYEIFNFVFKQVWESIDSFDTEYGLPKNSRRIENNATYDFFKGIVLIRGTINYRDNHLIKYEWNANSEEFVLVADEGVEEIDDAHNSKMVYESKGNKILVEVISYEDNCISYLVKDAKGKVLDIPQRIHDELLCSRVTSIAPDGRFLIYTDLLKNAICLFDFELKTTTILLADFKSYEGVSEVDWAPGKLSRFAFISVNHEEVLGNTKLHIFTFDKKMALKGHNYPLKIHYECDFEGWCVPQKDYNYKFDQYNRFVYTPEPNGVFKALVIQ